MKKVERVNIDAYNKYMGVETLHPLVSIIDFSRLSPIHSFLFNIDFYAVFLKETKNGTLTYGRQYYDYQEGSIVGYQDGEVHFFRLRRKRGVTPLRTGKTHHP